MNLIFIAIFLIFLIYFINEKIIKINFLSNYKGYKHQKFSGFKNVPLSGGPFLVCSCLIFFYFSDYNYLLALFLILIFFVGFIADTN